MVTERSMYLVILSIGSVATLDQRLEVMINRIQVTRYEMEAFEPIIRKLRREPFRGANRFARAWWPPSVTDRPAIPIGHESRERSQKSHGDDRVGPGPGMVD